MKGSKILKAASILTLAVTLTACGNTGATNTPITDDSGKVEEVVIELEELLDAYFNASNSLIKGSVSYDNYENISFTSESSSNYQDTITLTYKETEESSVAITNSFDVYSKNSRVFTWSRSGKGKDTIFNYITKTTEQNLSYSVDENSLLIKREIDRITETAHTMGATSMGDFIVTEKSTITVKGEEPVEEAKYYVFENEAEFKEAAVEISNTLVYNDPHSFFGLSSLLTTNDNVKIEKDDKKYTAKMDLVIYTSDFNGEEGYEGIDFSKGTVEIVIDNDKFASVASKVSIRYLSAEGNVASETAEHKSNFSYSPDILKPINRGQEEINGSSLISHLKFDY